MSNVIRLKCITTKIGSGATPTGGDSAYIEEGISLIRSQNVQDMHFSENGLAFINDDQAAKLKGVTVEKNDILLNITGDSIARCCVVPESIIPARVNQHVCIIRCKDSESAYYVNYYLQYLKSYLLKICRVGGTRNALTKDVIENLGINLPDDHKSRAAILTAIDEKITLNNRINSELEDMINLLYAYWFMQFDFPDKNGQPYRSSRGKMFYNEKLKREIPEGWKVESLSKMIASYKTGDWGEEHPRGNHTVQVSCIRGADINGLNGIGEAEPPTRFILDKNSNKVLAPHDLIIEISGGSPTQSTGRLAFITQGVLDRFDSPLICSNFCKGITLKSNELFYYFICLWNSLYNNGVLFGWEGKTSGIKNLLFESFVSNYQAVIPDENVLKEFAKTVSPLQEKKQLNLTENKQLAQLRDWLLPLLMNGQVTVSEL